MTHFFSYGESKNGNFAVTLEGDSTWREVEVLGELYRPLSCDLDSLPNEEFERMMRLEKKLKSGLA